MRKIKSLISTSFFLIAISLQSQGIINSVGFSFNDKWKMENNPEILDSAASIGYRYLGDSAFSFRVDALIRVNTVPKMITIKQMDISAFAKAIGMNRIVTACEGVNWMSSILVANNSDSQHIAFHRMGVLNGVVLELLLFFKTIEMKESH